MGGIAFDLALYRRPGGEARAVGPSPDGTSYFRGRWMGIMHLTHIVATDSLMLVSPHWRSEPDPAGRGARSAISQPAQALANGHRSRRLFRLSRGRDSRNLRSVPGASLVDLINRKGIAVAHAIRLSSPNLKLIAFSVAGDPVEHVFSCAAAAFTRYVMFSSQRDTDANQ